MGWVQNDESRCAIMRRWLMEAQFSPEICLQSMVHGGLRTTWDDPGNVLRLFCGYSDNGGKEVPDSEPDDR